ncbi:MAG TPA: NAD(P)/FAD-dependent oxidoreductase [Terriglobales bacterium]|jgi:phytoene dehydrogenase-like protein|nr:NAD(P)/FAD-dependent oxidoreductase [Terriglobales bacterium]
MPSSSKYDAIVIGGGHNGLTTAAYLARAGKKVLVLERRHVLGGAAVTEEVFPGFKFSVCSYVVSLLRPEIIRDLDLPRHGLEILPLDGTFTPMPSGDYLWRVNDHGKTHREIARHSKLDAEAYDEFGKAMQAMCRFVKPILSMVPPDPATLRPKELMKLLFIGRRFQGMTSEDKYNQVQLMTMSAIDFLDQWFETDVLKATMSASGIIGTFLGVRSPGTAYVLLHHYMGEIDGAFRSWGFARGGTGAISNAIADAAREAGAEIRTQAPIAKIIVKNSKATGVVLSDGDEIYADIISSSVDPRLTFTKFIEDGTLPVEFLEEVNRYKFRGSSGKVNLALDALPSFKCMPGPGAHLRGAISISPSVEYMERAYDDAKYGNFSRRPYIDMVIPTLTDPSVAPPGKHIMSCFVQYAPYKLRPGLNWDDQKEAFGDNVINTIAEYAPNIKDIILHRQVVTPLDLEREFGLSEGNIFQGELSLEQLFFLRPVPGWAQFRTPIKNLYMCGSATHPGGGIMGGPGRLAALEILKDFKGLA